MMRAVLYIVVIQSLTFQAFAPPVNKKTEEKSESVDPFDWANNAEYKHYLMEVLTELEKDSEFQKRLETLKNHSDSGSVADQLRFASHNVRSRLDEIKRKEITRLNQLEKKMERLHVDHSNPHSFEIQDLQKLINSVANDLVEVDNKQEEEFKRYEMEKTLKEKQRLAKIKDKKLRKEEEEKLEESKRRHRKHEPLHHPGSEEQLKDVWEKEDQLDRDAFDPKTFFALHDRDQNGHLDASEIESLMMKELEKVYDDSNPDDDVMERYHEMMKMRQELMREVDINNDKMVTYDEFKAWTQKKEFKEDPGWKVREDRETTEEQEKPVFTDEELQKFQEVYMKQHPDENFEDMKDYEDGTIDPRHRPQTPLESVDTSKPHVNVQPGTAGEKPNKL